jgi:hypothetical protein
VPPKLLDFRYHSTHQYLIVPGKSKEATFGGVLLVPCIIGESRLRVRMRLCWAEGLAERLKAATAKGLTVAQHDSWPSISGQTWSQ